MSVRVVAGSMGSFLDPPGSPQRHWMVIDGLTRNPRAMMSLTGALAEEWVPESVKVRVRQLLADAAIECSEGWLREVYSYYRGYYSPDGKDRNVANAVTGERGPSHHLAVLAVREWFPEHEPRMDLIQGESV